MKKHYGIIIAVVTILLGIGIGYALFSTAINISGSAKTSGDFEVIIDNDLTATKLITEVGSTNADISVSFDQKRATISVPELAYPGAYAEFQVTIKNDGTIPAYLKAITPTDLAETDIVITYSGVSIDDPLAVDATHVVTVKVQWDNDSTTTYASNISFDITFDYEQSV